LEHVKGKPPLFVLLGPTAAGKTKLSLELAQTFHGEIISGDSMQVYRGMDIGTAKVNRAERSQVPHHLIDICDPTEPFSVADYQLQTKQKIHEITSRGKLPMIVGGTGLYIESVCYDYQFSSVGQDEAYRATLEQYANQAGDEALHKKLMEVDSASASRLHPHDRRRIIRSLEIAHVSGSTHSELLASQVKESPYDLCIVGINMERSLLYQRVEQRIDDMLEKGLLSEVQLLLDQGVPRESIAMQALGYKELIGYIDGAYSYDHAIYLSKRNTRHYAKRQCSWFNHMDEINWIDVSDSTKFTTHFQLISDIINLMLPNHAGLNKKIQ
jgi:tRNA dimethylallyltransferase